MLRLNLLIVHRICAAIATNHLFFGPQWNRLPHRSTFYIFMSAAAHNGIFLWKKLCWWSVQSGDRRVVVRDSENTQVLSIVIPARIGLGRAVYVLVWVT